MRCSVVYQQACANKMASGEEESTELSEEIQCSQKPVDRKKRFRWDKDNKVDNLIRCLANYKSQKEFQNSDFDADRVKQYESVRVALATIYSTDLTLFGPPSAVFSPLFSRSDESLNNEEKREKQKLLKQHKEEKDLIKKGYQRIQEKLKEIRQNFSIAVTTGRRSGSGKVVLDFYEELVEIWGGSPATQPLSCGTSTDQVNSNATATPICVPAEIIESGSDDDMHINSFEDTIHSQIDAVDPTDTMGSGTGSSGINRKREAANAVPKLIDNKRRNMERQLSAAQRDQLLLKESKEDSQFKRDITEAIRQSNTTFQSSMQQMSSSIVQVAQSLTQSMEMMGRTFMQQNTPNVMPYQPRYHGQVPVVVPNHNYGIQQVSRSASNDGGNIETENWTYQTL